MEIVGAGAGVAAGFGAGAGGHVGDAERGHGIAERGGLAGGEDDGDLREDDAEGGDESEQGGVREVAVRIGLVLVVSCVGAHAGECDGELRLPAVLVEIFKMGGEGQRFVFPIRQTEQGADADTTEAASVGTLRAIQPPVEFPFGTRGVQGFVGFPVIGFLINDQPLGTVIDDFGILFILHGADFKGQRWEKRDERVEAFLEVAFGNELRVLSGDEQEVAETLGMEVLRLGNDLIYGKCSTQDRGIPGKAAIGTVVHAFVRDIKRREKSHGFPEIPARDLLAFQRQRLQGYLLIKQAGEAAHKRRRTG